MSELSLRGRVMRLGHPRLLAILGVAGMIAALGFAMDRSSYDVWGAFWVGPVLLALTVPFIRWIQRTEGGDPRVGHVLLLGFGAKVIVGSLLRYAMVHGIYGSGDSIRYAKAGEVLAPLFRQLDYQNLGKISGTRFLEILTGQVFALIGPTDLGAFMLFSWLAFIGLLLMVRAFRIAVPAGDHARYRLLVLFFPTVVFWPSSIGKDAWMVFCIGLASFGVAKLVTGKLGGLIPGSLGLWGAAVVRPHIALLVVMAAAIAVGLRTFGPGEDRAVSPNRARGLVAGLVLVVGIVVLFGTAEQFFGIDSLNPESADSVLTSVEERTGQGGSEFETPSPKNPVGFGIALVTVLFRPFPYEVGGTGFISSIEGMFFVTVVCLSLPRVARLPSMAFRSPYLLFAVAYVLGFAYAFSSIGNFGILARQRCQLLPVAFILLSLPRKPGVRRPGRLTRQPDHTRALAAPPT